MKAKEYFAEYCKQLVMDDYDIKKLIEESENEEEAQHKMDEFFREGVSELIKAMNREVQAIIEHRHCKTDSAAAAVIQEMNGRWNAMIPMFEKRYGKSPLVRNGYAIFWIRELPSLSKYIKI